MPRQPTVLFTFLLLLLLGAACSQQPPAPEATATDDLSFIETVPAELRASPTATESSTAVPTATDTAEPDEATAVPQPSVLPAPLYFIGDNGQIMRLEADNTSVTAVTDEPEPITAFDVFPSDNRLVYVTGNTLIELAGEERFVKVTGEALGEEGDPANINRRITLPRYSPDGLLIAFGLSGANAVASGPTTDYIVVQPSDPHPDEPGVDVDLTGDPIQFFQPADAAWSPDVNRLLLEFSYYPEAGGLAIKPVDEDSLITLTSPDGIVCCDAAWSIDGTAVYFSSPFDGLIPPGMWRADAATGTGQVVVPGYPADAGGETNYVSHAAQLDDGRLYAFHTASSEPFTGDIPLTLSRLEDAFVPLRDDAQLVRDVLWADDASGAVIVAIPGEGLPFSQSGPLMWIPADGGPIVALAEGTQPRWGGVNGGVPQPVGAPVPAEMTPTATPLPDAATDCSNAAAFVADVTVPDGTTVEAGQTFTKTWQMRNTGDCTWTTDYRWTFTEGDQLGDVTALALPTAVAPNDLLEISVELTAPEEAGSYQGYWQLQAPDGANFGTEVYVLVTVTAP